MKKSTIYSQAPKVKHTLVLLSAMLIATGCNSDKQEELENYLSTVKNRPMKPIAPIPAIKPYLRYIYPEHDIDPFDVSILAPVITPVSEIKHVDKGIEVDTSRVPEFLEGYPLDSLNMVGTLNKDGSLWALIRVPDGSIQRVKKGNYIGKNFGKIEDITDSRISLKEVVPNGFGGYKPRENAISISNLD